MSETATTIVLADDHPVYRKGLRDVIEVRSECVVVAEAGNGDEALQLVEEKQPDIVVLDVEMPGLSGLDVAGRIQEKQLDTAVVMLTMHREPIYFFQSMEAGVSAYVLKDSAILEILASIDHVREGEFYLSSELRGLLLEHRMKKRRLRSEQRGIETLTMTEQKVLNLIAEGGTTREVAYEMGTSPRTVEHHRSNICRKLDLKGNNALLRFALEYRTMF